MDRVETGSAGTGPATSGSGAWEGDTVPQAAVPAVSGPEPTVDTVELPAVGTEPPEAPAPPAAWPLAGRRLPRRRFPRRRVRALAAGIVVIGLIVAVLGGLRWANSPGHSAGSSTAGTSIGRLLAPTSVTSVDPVGGSGLRQGEPGVWRTQRYRSAAYGGLKPGVGLLVDLGTSKRVRAATMTATPGAAVELWAGDRPTQSPDGFRSAARQEVGDGPTTLRAAEGGAHRYWLVWVTRLAPDNDGYAAELRDLKLSG